MKRILLTLILIASFKIMDAQTDKDSSYFENPYSNYKNCDECLVGWKEVEYDSSDFGRENNKSKKELKNTRVGQELNRTKETTINILSAALSIATIGVLTSVLTK